MPSANAASVTAAMYSCGSRALEKDELRGALAEGDRDRLLLPAAHDRQRHAIARAKVEEHVRERMRGVDRAIVHLEDDVEAAEAGGVGGRARLHRSDDGAVARAQVVVRGVLRIVRDRLHAEEGALHPAPTRSRAAARSR